MADPLDSFRILRQGDGYMTISEVPAPEGDTPDERQNLPPPDEIDEEPAETLDEMIRLEREPAFGRMVLDPDSVIGLVADGYEMIDRGLFEEAERAARMAIRVSEIRAERSSVLCRAYVLLAESFRKQGKLDAAEEWAERAYGLADQIPLHRLFAMNAACELWQVLDEQGRVEEAADWRKRHHLLFETYRPSRESGRSRGKPE